MKLYPGYVPPRPRGVTRWLWFRAYLYSWWIAFRKPLDVSDPRRITYERDGSGGPVSITVACFTCNTYDYAHESDSAEDHDRAGTAAGE